MIQLIHVIKYGLQNRFNKVVFPSNGLFNTTEIIINLDPPKKPKIGTMWSSINNRRINVSGRDAYFCEGKLNNPELKYMTLSEYKYIFKTFIEPIFLIDTNQ